MVTIFEFNELSIPPDKTRSLHFQYFGNVVTCYWWDEIWINEGFARFYESRGVDVFEPGFGVVSIFII